MTNETTVTTETPVDTHKNNAVQFVNSRSMADIIDHISDQYKLLENSKEYNKVIRTKLQETVDTVTEFIKDNYDDGATTDEIKELADELDIELSKELTVSFTANVEVTLTVPIGFDEDSIHDGMFSVSVESNYRNDEIEWDNDSIEIDDFEVEEN